MPELSHPDKILYPETGTTKLAIANYYKAIYPKLLPFIANRPLSIVRTPSGVDGQRFYQKHPQDYFPEFIEEISIKEKTKWDQYFTIDALEDIEFFIQMNTLEFHIWGSTTTNLEMPDQMVFDLDPDPESPWQNVIFGAHEIKKLMTDFGLTSFVKTSGKKGLHVVIPLQPKADWETVHDFAQSIAKQLATNYPDRFTAALPKEERIGKVFIDYLRNTRGSTAIVNYSTRVFKRPTVAMPIEWDEVDSVKPDQFDINNAVERVSKTKDPWAEFNASAGLLPKSA
jgi:bifunctional non-homologous end joining protein LigD